ncbi:ABC transporter permease [Planotetraspora kaengkrachanensis]|uniref:Spermidine/putrescine ABC transporter permease n=1 Tax=Planotetraspora kaengkrachanensis TaxID=575193 RepID=A0A8J3PXD8_9ACTN|nr:ABC transporter permease [Planotetraspora kaengkrachanensis]GIG82845.1 spermidine/putrescine ABC transporter permease [Planotetraspora kaengkrachanensis]
MSRRNAVLLLVPGLALLLFGFLVPAVMMLLHPPDTPALDVGHRLAQMLADPFMLGIIWRTLRIGLIVTAVCLLLGFPVAYLLSRSTSRWSGLLLALAIFPLLLSNVVRTYGWLVVLGSKGVIAQALTGLGITDHPPQLLYTETAVVAGLVQLFLPLAIVSCYSSLSGIEARLEDAARGLGASRTATFRLVLLPLAMPGAVVGATLVFAGAATAYTTPVLLGGTRQTMLSLQLFNYSSVTIDWAGASAVALLMTALVFAVAGASAWAGRRRVTA